MDCLTCGIRLKPGAPFCHECGRAIQLPFWVTNREELDVYSGQRGNRVPVKDVKKYPPVALYELQDGRFQLVEQGPITPFMAGFGYVLVEAALGDYLDQLGMPGLEVRDAVIWNRKKSIEYSTHKRLFLEHHFEAWQIGALDIKGQRMMLMNDRYVFVTPRLKVRLERQSSFNYLGFSEGWRWFC